MSPRRPPFVVRKRRDGLRHMNTRTFILYILSAVSVIASPIDEAKAFKAKRLYQPAIDILEKEVQRNPADLDALREYADALFRAKQWEKAIPWLERAIVADKKYQS